MKSDIAKLIFHVREIFKIGKRLGVKNPLYNDQWVEMSMADILGHECNPGQGEDARESNGDKAEYKCSLKYSYQFHWLSKDKIERYKQCKNVYLGHREGADIVEIWKIPMKKIFPYLYKEYKKADKKMKILNENMKSKKKKNIDAHKTFSLEKMIELGAKKVYDGNK